MAQLMSDWFWGGAALIVGFLTGLFYFGGLWWTVERVGAAQSPGLLLLASFTVRTAVAILAFYLIMGGEWTRLLIALAGFFIARYILIRRYGIKIK
jgi:F1F0 ATPase subunit 2